MHIRLIKNLDELAPYKEDWDRLAYGVPFLSWTWLSHWWQSYGLSEYAHNKPQLSVLAAFDESKTLVGIVPWYLDSSIAHGRVLRMLGSGEVCSDYLSMLCQRGMEEDLAQAVAEFLLEESADELHESMRWDLIELDGVEFEDRTMNQLADQMAQLGCTTHRRSKFNCWRLDLPSTWDQYMDALSRSFRRQARRLERDFFEKGRAVLRVVERLHNLPRAMDILVDMHQKRRQSLGEPGCFASPCFEAFFRSVLPELMRQGQLQFHLLELDGRPIAAEYDLIGGGILYAYQAGVDPEAMEFQPGKLLALAIIRRAIEQGFKAFDFLRGDEPYKAHFRAFPRPSVEIRIVPNRAAALLRHNLWLAGRQVKQWIKRSDKGQETGNRES